MVDRLRHAGQLLLVFGLPVEDYVFSLFHVQQGVRVAPDQLGLPVGFRSQFSIGDGVD